MDSIKVLLWTSLVNLANPSFPMVSLGTTCFITCGHRIHVSRTHSDAKGPGKFGQVLTRKRNMVWRYHTTIEIWNVLKYWNVVTPGDTSSRLKILKSHHTAQTSHHIWRHEYLKSHHDAEVTSRTWLIDKRKHCGRQWIQQIVSSYFFDQNQEIVAHAQSMQFLIEICSWLIAV